MKQTEERDEWLMTQVADGEHAALEPLIRRYAVPLLTFIRRMVGDAHQSEELFQEAFVAVWVKRRHYRFPRPFKPWLYAIAINKCRAAFRRTHPASLDAGGDPDSFEHQTARGPTPMEAAIAIESAALVTSAVAQLPPQQRMVVVMRIWNGMSYAEIADVLERSEATVRSHMHHGLAALRTNLEPRLS